MTVRIISFLAGALFGALCTLAVLHVVGDLHTNWWVLCVVAAAMGLLAAFFGKKFWEMVLTIWS